MSIQEYIETHNLSKRVEETINAAVKAKAPEPISFMVCKNSFSRLVVSSCFPSAQIFVKSESFLAASLSTWNAALRFMGSVSPLTSTLATSGEPRDAVVAWRK